MRLCLIGPECTGKTAIAERLGRELGVPWVPEFAREYAQSHGELGAADVESIARGEMASLDRQTSDGLVVLDTDLISTVVYARHYYGSCPPWIEEEARRRRAGLYLLMDTDLEWIPDGVRDSSGDSREDLFDAFRAALDEFDTHWTIVSGTWEERWEAVGRAMDSLDAEH